MTGSRPAAAPALLAALTASVPGRLVRKLDQAPRVADGWSWAVAEDGRTTVTTDGGDRVELRPEGGLLTAASQLSCSCLLAPRCLHLLAVVTVLPVQEADAAEVAGAAVADEAAAGEGAAGAAAPADGDQREAAASALRSLAELVAAGAQGAGLVLQGELLRSIHACRAAGLPRLSAALLTVLDGARACREDSPAFALGPHARALVEGLGVARALAAGEADPALVGVARRGYAEAGSLRLHGLCSEPILTASGYAGVVTLLVDAGGVGFTLADVAPGDAARIPGAYAGAARLGGGTLSHRELSRSGLMIEGATASADGRLGAGQGVRAVRAGPSRWDAPPLAALFQAPLAQQLDRAFEGEAVPRPLAGLLCFDATVAGRGAEGLRLDARDGAGATRRLEAIAGDPAGELPWRQNLALLAGSPGLRLRCVARALLERPSQVVLLAIEASPGGGGEGVSPPAFPPEWAGRCNVGLDRLQGAHVAVEGAPAAEAPAAVAPVSDEVAALRRRVERLALGGRGTLFPAALAEVEREAAQLGALLMPTGAAVARALAGAALARGAGSVERLAEAFLAAGTYLAVADRALRRAEWDGR